MGPPCSTTSLRDTASSVSQVLETLLRHRVSNMALTGSVAVRHWIVGSTADLRFRDTNDIDLVVDSITDLPGSLGQAFLCSHVHPHAPHGRLLAQLVDPSSAMRVDVFRARGAALGRAQSAWIGKRHLKVLSLDDLAANTARLLTNLSRGETVARKYAADFVLLLQHIDSGVIDAVWSDYRRADDDHSFSLAARNIHRLIKAFPDKLIDPQLDTDPDVVCRRCRNIRGLNPAPRHAVLEVLGYV